MLFRLFAGPLITLLCITSAQAIELDRPEIESFIDMMVEKHDFEREALRDVLGSAEKKQKILDAIARPAEKSKSWGEYRDIFLTSERIDAGAAFWEENRGMLETIASETGVPVEILVGIIGVETYYGRITGSYRVLDALSTLAFYYPPRSRFFRRELEEYLLLVREEGMQAGDATGSYAGAMGRPQFMPSSFRAYAGRLDRRWQARHLEQLDRRRWQHRELLPGAWLEIRPRRDRAGIPRRRLERSCTGTGEYAQAERDDRIVESPGRDVRQCFTR